MREKSISSSEAMQRERKERKNEPEEARRELERLVQEGGSRIRE